MLILLQFSFNWHQTMIEQSILEITSALSRANNIVIVPHKGPDGDAIGSTLGL